MDQIQQLLNKITFEEVWNTVTLTLLISAIIFNLIKSRQKDINKILLAATGLFSGLVPISGTIIRPQLLPWSIVIFVATLIFWKKKEKKPCTYMYASNN